VPIFPIPIPPTTTTTAAPNKTPPSPFAQQIVITARCIVTPRVARKLSPAPTPFSPKYTTSTSPYPRNPATPDQLRDTNPRTDTTQLRSATWSLEASCHT
ncbi:uncharacterized protein CCOS01_12178, partial [Colletotrichum costaricense]